MRRIIILSVLFLALAESASAYGNAVPYIGIITMLITFPAFVALYIHLQQTNLGKTLMQPMLAMFVGYFGLMLNSSIDLLRLANTENTENYLFIMSINRIISSILIGLGCVLLFFSLKKNGLLHYTYYKKKR